MGVFFKAALGAGNQKENLKTTANKQMGKKKGGSAKKLPRPGKKQEANNS